MQTRSGNWAEISAWFSGRIFSQNRADLAGIALTLYRNRVKRREHGENAVGCFSLYK